jgi:MFS family permease
VGFLLLDGPGTAPWVLALSFAQETLEAFFRPAAQASVPSLVAPEALSAAGTLDGLSWSLGLVVGSALGGITVDLLGRPAAFAIDSASFLLSAALLAGLPLPRVAADLGPRRSTLGDLAELREEVARRPQLAAAMLAKCAWGVGSAQLLLLTTFGADVLGTAAASTGFGLLYAARGTGTAVGPFLARIAFGESDRAIRLSMAAGFVAAAAFYAGFGMRPPLPFALLCVTGAHMGGSAIWIGATVLVQRHAPDRVRGRAFAAEMALHTLTACASPIAAALLVDAGTDPSDVVLLFAGATLLLGLAWTTLAERAARRASAVGE